MLSATPHYPRPWFTQRHLHDRLQYRFFFFIQKAVRRGHQRNTRSVPSVCLVTAETAEFTMRATLTQTSLPLTVFAAAFAGVGAEHIARHVATIRDVTLVATEGLALVARRSLETMAALQAHPYRCSPDCVRNMFAMAMPAHKQRMHARNCSTAPTSTYRQFVKRWMVWRYNALDHAFKYSFHRSIPTSMSHSFPRHSAIPRGRGVPCLA